MATAHADIPVPRVALNSAEGRKHIRMVLYRKLTKMGRVRTIRYVRDPLDGPLADQGLPSDDTAIVRAIAEVIPNA